MSVANPERVSPKLQEELDRLWEPYKGLQFALNQLLMGERINDAFTFLGHEFGKIRPGPRVLYQGPAGGGRWQKGLALREEQALILNNGQRKTGFLVFYPENRAFYLYANSIDTTTDKGVRESTARDMLATHAQIFENPNKFLEQMQRRKLMLLTLGAIFKMRENGLKALYSAPRRGPDFSRYL